jgi:hypothetical protein
VLSAIAIIPSAPVMVPELAGGGAAELADLRAAVFAAASSLPARWVAIGVGSTDAFVGARGVGTFAGYGVDVVVTLSPGDGVGPLPLTSREHAIRDGLPLCALITGWVRGQVKAEARASVHVYTDDLDVESALDRGRRLRTEIDEVADDLGVLVVADGLHTLTQPAPGGYDSESIPVQAALDDALARGDVGALTRLPDGVVGRVAYQVLAGLVDPAPRSARELYRGAPYGVGYFVGLWQP